MIYIGLKFATTKNQEKKLQLGVTATLFNQLPIRKNRADNCMVFEIVETRGIFAFTGTSPNVGRTSFSIEKSKTGLGMIARQNELISMNERFMPSSDAVTELMFYQSIIKMQDLKVKFIERAPAYGPGEALWHLSQKEKSFDKLMKLEVKNGISFKQVDVGHAKKHSQR